MGRALSLIGLFTTLLFTLTNLSACTGCSAHPARLTQNIDGPSTLSPESIVEPDVPLDELLPGQGAACTKAIDCDDGNPCTEEHCVDLVCELTALPTDVCCQAIPLVALDFDALDPEALDTDAPIGGASWGLSLQRAVSAPASLTFGDPATATLGSDQRVIGAVRLPPLTLPESSVSRLTFRLFVDIESSLHRDQLQLFVDVLDASGAVVEAILLMDKVDLPPEAYAGFALIDLPLDDLAGQAVRLRLDFDSVEAPNPGSEGVFIDDLEIATVCPDAPLDDDLPVLDDGTTTGLGDEELDDDVDPDGEGITTPSDEEDGDDSSDTEAPPAIVSGGSTDPCDAPDAHEGCCTSDADCDDGNPATVNVCEGAECVAAWNPDACTTAADCDDAEACTLDACVDSLCTHEGTFGTACCAEGSHPLADFDTESLQGLFVTDNLETGVFWRTDPTRATSGDVALYCGEPVAQTYGIGARVKSSATTPVLSLPVGGHTTLLFDLFMVTRPALEVDVFQIFVLRGGALIPVWSSKVLPAGNTVGFMPVQVDLASFAGQDVQLRFVFDSVDAHAPAVEGTYLDSLRLETTCL